MFLSTATITELSFGLIGVIGAIAGCIHGSKCTKIKCGISGLECEREVVVEENETKEEEVKKDTRSKKKDDFSRALEDPV